MTAEQAARDMLERMGWERAQELSAGDVVELANLIADVWALQRAIPDWRRLATPLDRMSAYYPAPAVSP